MKEDVKIRVVNRDSIQKVLEENSFSLSGLTQKQTSLLGKLLNADVLIFPSGLSLNSNDEYYSKKDKRCIIRKAYANISIKAVRADNAEVIISDNYDAEESYEECAKSAVRSKVPSSERVKVEALTKAIEKFTSDFKDRL
jgi:curli biogenesis system outer membrane secretion channel CsgG